MMGASSDLDKSLFMLNGKIIWQDDGIEHNPDTKHCDRVVVALNLQYAKSVVTPAVKGNERVDGKSIRECS